MTPTCPVCRRPVDAADLAGVRVVLAENMIVVNGAAARLRPREAAIADVLARAMPATVSRGALMDLLYGAGTRFHRDPRYPKPDRHVMDVFVCKLRRDIRPLGLAIVPVYGVGWRMELDAGLRASCERTPTGVTSAREEGGDHVVAR